MSITKRRPLRLMGDIRMAPSRSVRSAVLVAPGQQWRPSMERTARELELNLSALGVRTQRVSPPGAGWLGRFALLPFSTAVQRADVFHIVDHSLGHAAALLPRSRTVITVHDLYLLREAATGSPVAPRHLAQFRFSTNFLRTAGAIVAQTETTKADVVEYLGIDPARVDVVRLGVDESFRPLPAEDRAKARAEWGLSGPTIVQVGNSPYKNLTAVVDTLAAVRRAGFDATVLHVGDPIAPADLAHAEQQGISRQIRQLGRLTDHDLVRLFNAGDVLLFPSRWEGMGWPPLEAMACGLPVVASDIPAVAEVTGGAALLAAPTDIDGLTQHVVRLLSEPTLAETQRALGLKQAALYNWTSTAQAYLEIYERIRKGH